MAILRPGGERLLEAVGIGETEETVYRHLLGSPGLTISQISQQLSASTREIRRLLSNLERAGLVSRSTGRSKGFVPSPPEAAIEVLVLDRQQDLERARLAAREMEASFRATGVMQAHPLDIVEVVVGRDAVDKRFIQLHKSAEHQVRVFDRPPYGDDPLAPNELELELLAQGIDCRVVYASEGLSLPGRMEHLRGAADAGENARTLPNLPMKLFISDDRVAFIPLSLDEPGMEGALLIKPSPVLEALMTLFETLWERAAPIDFSAAQGPSARGASEDLLADEDQQVLTLLVAGLKDQTIARQMDVAHRTVLRRVANLMKKLGAQTRFQAGWLAAKRNEGG